MNRSKRLPRGNSEAVARFQNPFDSTISTTLLAAALILGAFPGRVLFAQQIQPHARKDLSPKVARVTGTQHPPQPEEKKLEPSLHILNVQAFGAVGDGHTLDTQAISRAVKRCSGSGGCTLVFPPGRYRTGTFELLSNVTLDLEPGSVLEGSTNMNDYGYVADYGFGRTYPVNSTGEGIRMGMIIARNAVNVAIVGRGAIDGNGDSFMNLDEPHVVLSFRDRLARNPEGLLKALHNLQFGPVQPKDNGKGRPGTLMIFSHCRNVLIRGVTIRDAPNWTLHLFHCNHAVVTGVRILNSLKIPNDDGIDCIGSRDVHISNCDIRAGDDDMAIVNSRNVTGVNCSLISHSSAIKLENTQYSTFTNMTILSNRGISIFHQAGDMTKDILFSNLVIRTKLITGGWWGKAEPIYISTNHATKGNDSGYIRDVRFSNILADSQAGILLKGSEACPIQGISLDGVKLHIAAPRPQIAAEVGGNFDLSTVGGPLDALYKHDIPALYCEHVNNLTIRDFEVSWDDHLPSYFSSAIECQDFHNLQVDGFEGRQAHLKGSAPAIALSDGSGVSIRNAMAAPGTGTFLALHNVREQGLFVGNDVKNARRAFGTPKYAFSMSGNLLPKRAGQRP